MQTKKLLGYLVSTWRWFRVFVVLFVVLWALSPYFVLIMSILLTENELQLKQWLETSGELEELKLWAVDRIETQEWLGVDGEREKLAMRIDYLAPIRGKDGKRIYSGKDGKIVYFELYLDSGHRHRGLYVGPPGFKPMGDPWPYLNQWCDQVWYFDDVVPH